MSIPDLPAVRTERTPWIQACPSNQAHCPLSRGAEWSWIPTIPRSVSNHWSGVCVIGTNRQPRGVIPSPAVSMATQPPSPSPFPLGSERRFHSHHRVANYGFVGCIYPASMARGITTNCIFQHHVEHFN